MLVKLFSWTAWVMYALNGAASVILGAMLPSLLIHYKISYAVGGQLVLLQFIGFLGGVAASSLLLHRISPRSMLVIASLCTLVGEVGIGSLPGIPLLAILSFVNGFGLAAAQTTIISSILLWFEGRRAVIVSRLEVAFGVGALLMPLIASWLIAINDWATGFWIIGLLSLVLAFAWPFIPIHPELNNRTGPMDAPNAATRSTGRLARLTLLILFLTMIFLYVGIESCLNSFLPSMFIPYLGQPASDASLAIAVFWFAMVIGRTLTGYVVRKVAYARFLLWSISGTVLFLIGLTLWRNIFFAYTLIFMIGLTMSGIYAITMVFTNHAFPGQTRNITGLVTAFAGLGGAVLPAALGWLMDHLPIVEVLWTIVLFTVLLLASLLTILFVERPQPS